MITTGEIRALHVELTTNCQAACPLCPRNDYGFTTRSDFPLTELTIDKWKKIFDDVVLDIKHITFNGNYGDPTIATDILEIIRYSYDRWPGVEFKIHTNGGIRSTKWWAELGDRSKYDNLVVQFAIDGLEDTNHLYRRNVPYSKAIENAKAFIDAGGTAFWQMIRFKHNMHQFQEAEQISKDMGFRYFRLIDDGRNHGYVFDKDESYWILPAEEEFVNNKLIPNPTQPIKPSLIDIKNFEIEKSKWLSSDKKLSCNTKRLNRVFLAANGEMFPCCYIGHYPKQYKKWFTNFNRVIGNVENNALEVGFEKAISWFNAVEESWKDTNEIVSTCLGCRVVN
jgi:MoaA/NifB/PqqE/SkfB family radical SAM enzyme